MAKVFNVRAPASIDLAKMSEKEIYALVETESTKLLSSFPRQARPVGVNMVSVSQMPGSGAGDWGGWAEWTRACCGSRRLIDEYTDPTPEEMGAAGLAYRPQQRAHIESSFTIQTPANAAMHGGTPSKG